MAVEIRLLGGFEVRSVGAGPAAVRRRTASSLVKVLALAPGHRLHRERVLDLLWPDLAADEATPRLHKAAHHARRELGSPEAVVLRNEVVALFPDDEVGVDALAFEQAASAALAAQDPVAAGVALGLHRGELLPDDLYEPWTYEARERVGRLHVELLRLAGRWEEVLEVDVLDEHAHLALLRRHAAAGDRAAALRQYERMAHALRDHLGVEPGPDAVAIRARILASVGPGPPRPPRPTSAGAGLVEREAPLRALAAAAAEAAAGLGSVVLVSGEAGIGKTALVEALADELAGRATVLVGGCDDLLTARPFGPFQDVARAGAAELAAALAGDRPAQVHEALLDLMRAAPTVLVVEDLHWADDATLDAVRYLARRAPGTPSLLVLTYREDEVGPGHPLRRLLGTLAGPGSRRVRLEALSPEAVDELARRAGVAHGQLHQVTRGNPFFVSELLAAGATGVPPTVRDAVLARVERLPAAAQELVQRLSVAPTPVERDLAEAWCGEGAVGALRDAERRGVLVGDPTTVAFRHELARQAVEGSLTPAERVAHHRRFADLLDERGADPARVVHHAVAAGDRRLVVAAGRAAAAAALRAGAHRQVTAHLRVVLERPSVDVTPSERVDLLVRRAESLQLTNDFEESLRVASEAVDAAEEVGDASRLARALLAVGRTVLWARGPAAAQRAVRRALDVLGPDGHLELRALAHAELARALGELATVGPVAEGSPEALEHAAHGLALAEQLGRADLRARALTYLGSERVAVGDDRGEADLEQALALLEGNPQAEFAVRVCVNASGAAHRAGRPAAAERAVDLGLHLARDIEFPSGEFRLRLTRSAVLASTGRWRSAEDELRTLLVAEGDPGIMGPMARSLLARLLARQGRGAEAADVLAPALDAASGSDEVHLVGPVAAADLELTWLRDGTAGASGLVQRALRLAGSTGRTVCAAELVRYLQRAGVTAPVPVAPEPWASGLRGDWRAAAAGWAARGERYEQALELCSAGGAAPVAEGRAILRELAAGGALAALRQAGRRGASDCP